MKQIKENNKASKKLEILNKEMKEKEDFIKKLMEENEKLKQKSNVVLEEILLLKIMMTKMEEELEEKEKNKN